MCANLVCRSAAERGVFAHPTMATVEASSVESTTTTRTIKVEQVEVVEARTRSRSRATSVGTDGSRKHKGGAIGRGAVIRLDPSKIVVDLIHANLFVKEVTDIEVEAKIVRESRGEVPYRASSDSAQANRVSMSLEEVSGVVGWKPRAISRSFLEDSPAKEMRPQPYFPLDGKKTEVPVPTSSADLTPEWCTLAFRSRGFLASNEAVLHLSIHPLGAGEGEFSELVLLNLEEVQGDAPNLPRHLVAKFSPPNMSPMEMEGVFSPEAHFYNDFTISGGGLVRPVTAYVGYLRRRCGTPLYCIIMESAAPPTKAVTSFKRVDGCASVEHLTLAMQTLAKFHARWWNRDNKNPALTWSAHPDCAGGGALPRMPKAMAHMGWALIFKNGIKALPHCFSDNEPIYAGAPKFGQEYALFISKVRPVARRRRRSIVRELFRHPLTLCHGDAHLENIFFGEHYQGGCAFIDFGLTMFGQALCDVATVIGGGMPVQARRDHEQTLVKRYHAFLCDFGVKNCACAPPHIHGTCAP